MANDTGTTAAVDLENRAFDVEVSLYTMVGVSFCFLFLRFFCKVRYNKMIRVDDYLLAASWVRVPGLS